MKIFSCFRNAKKRTVILTTAAFISILTVPGCKDDDVVSAIVDTLTNSSTNDITINGNGYTNKKISFPLPTALYKPSLNMTGVEMSSIGSDTVMVTVVLSVPGKATGTYTWAEIDTTGLKTNAVVTIGKTTYVSGLSSNGSTKITAYNPVGGKVEGTYSGTLYNLVDASTITVSGKFSATRRVDD